MKWAGMKVHCVLTLLLTGATLAFAQGDNVNVDDLLKDGEQWLRENVDEKTLSALADMDPKELEKLCRELEQRFQGEVVIDLASLRPFAVALLPELEKYEETRPYAAWLRARLDYVDVAERLRPAVPPPTKPVPNPPPQVERQAWQTQLEKRPQPSAAEKYVSRLKPIFAAQQVPTELVWLAEVESVFNPSARSPAGAAGLFQLMPATARQQGLSLRPQDERLNPEKSAYATARHLKYLHGTFKDWKLAIAAYNAGEGRVRELLKRHKATTFDDIAVRLPAETQMYVPKVEATLQRREGVQLAKLASPS
jgi:membrane-bound lytic murein transglycosylase D